MAKPKKVAHPKLVTGEAKGQHRTHSVQRRRPQARHSSGKSQRPNRIGMG